MCRCGLVAVMVAVLWQAPLSGASPRPRRVLSLNSAIAAGHVRAVIVGTGASSGDSIKLIVAKTVRAPAGTLALTVAPGTIVRSTVDGYQSMVVAGVRGRYLGDGRYRPSSQIVVSGSRPVTYILQAYCTEPEKRDATPSVRFALARVDPVLGCIAVRGRGLSIPSLQSAVWRHSDGVEFETVNERLGLSKLGWTRAVSVVDSCSQRF